MTQIINAIFNGNININTTAFFILVILTGLALLGTYSTRFKKLTKYSKQSPAILATVGVFFSFYGISIGLIEFDPSNMKDSTPLLLNGLKVKFIASLMGIGFSIIVRIAQSFKSENNSSADIDSDKIIIDLLSDIKQSLAENSKDSPEQLLKELKDSIAILPIEFQKQSSLLEAIKTSLAGEGDASVTTQLVKVRMDMKDSLGELDKHNKQYFDELNDNNKQYLSAINKNIKEGFDNQNTVLNSSFKGLIDKFDEFARVLAENNSKAFIEALEKAMRDFNNNITEQFGENFKQLNAAVGQLLVWQENYKSHVEKLTDNFEVALSSIETINTAFSDIKNRSESFTTTSEKLHGILESLDRQLQDLSSHLQTFDEIAGNAKDAFPVIKNNLNDLTNGFKKSTQESLDNISETVKDVGDNLKEVSGKLKETTNAMRNVMEEQKDTLDSTSQEFKTVVNITLKNLAKDTQKSIDEYRDTLQTTVTEQLKVIETSVKQSNGLINKTIQDASGIFEQSINSTGDTLKIATDKVSSQLTTATGSMQSMIEGQEKTLINASGQFETVVNKTLNDLSKETQDSIRNYQHSLNSLIIEQSNTINAAIKNAGNEFENSVKKTADQFSGMASSIKQSVDIQEKTLTGVSKDFKATIDKTLHDLAEQSKTTIQQHERELQRAVQEQMNHISNAVKSSSEQFNKLLTENTTESTSVLKQQTKLLDTALQEELKKAIETMGSHLASLSNKFVQDYGSLAITLKEVVKLTDELKRGRN
jgi:DNA repair exonuclease SbcCD ATPase subunit